MGNSHVSTEQNLQVAGKGMFHCPLVLLFNPSERS